MTKTEHFSDYQFEVDYPNDWEVEVDPQSEMNRGHILFRSPKGFEIFVSWGPLIELKEKCRTSKEHSEKAIERLRKDRKVKFFELLESKAVRVNFHIAHFKHVRITQTFSTIPFIKKNSDSEIRSIHLHCARSGRYFVIYGMTPPDNSQEQKSVFEIISKSFRCHGLQKKTEG